MALQLVKDKDIKRKDYIKKDMTKEEKKDAILEYKFDKKTDLIPKKRNKLICILLTEDKGAVFLLRKINSKKNFFRYRKNKYIFDNKSIHITKNNARISVYLEGISTPLSMNNIEKFMEEIEWIDLDGTVKKESVMKIKGLKYDSSILDTFSDEHFADDFTKDKTKNLEIILLILGIISIIMIGICIGISYYFK
jgi:selenocysteine-specific translation elongation factor